MQIAGPIIDLSKVEVLVLLLPDGERFVVPMVGLMQFMELGPGRVCDTSEVDGVLHFFPRGNA